MHFSVLPRDVRRIGLPVQNFNGKVNQNVVDLYKASFEQIFVPTTPY